MSDKPELKKNEDEKPPLLKSWNTLYIFVLAQTALLIIIFYLFTRFFR